MFSKTMHSKTMYSLATALCLLLLAVPTYAAKVDSDSLRALLQSTDVRLQLRGATWSADYPSEDPKNMTLVNDLLIALLNRKGQLDKHEIKMIPSLTEALGYSYDPEHLSTLERAKTSGIKGLSSVASKAQSLAKSRAAPKLERDTLLERFTNVGGSTPLFIALLFSSTEYTREEGQNYLYTARIYPEQRFDIKQILATPKPDMSLLNTQLNSPIARERILAATQIFYMGYKSPDIHKTLLAHLTLFSSNKESIESNDEAAWEIKALAAQADINDKPFIGEFSKRAQGNLQFHSSLSLALLEKFIVWYAKIEATNFSKISETDLHLLLLQAPYLSIKDAAVHRFISVRNETTQVVDICYSELKFFWPYVHRNAREVRPAARMMQIMARGGNPKHKELLQEILENAPSKHLRAHAQENLSEFQ